jgi:hypothetical protein
MWNTIPLVPQPSAVHVLTRCAAADLQAQHSFYTCAMGSAISQSMPSEPPDSRAAAAARNAAATSWTEVTPPMEACSLKAILSAREAAATPSPARPRRQPRRRLVANHRETRWRDTGTLVGFLLPHFSVGEEWVQLAALHHTGGPADRDKERYKTRPQPGCFDVLALPRPTHLPTHQLRLHAEDLVLSGARQRSQTSTGRP